MQKSNAIVITAGYLTSSNGKTAHGLIRGTDRFNILGVIDPKEAGKDAGEILDGKKRQVNAKVLSLTAKIYEIHLEDIE